MNDIDRQVGRLEGVVGEFRGRFDTVDKNIAELFKEMNSLKNWKFQIMGGAGVSAILGSFIVHFMMKAFGIER